MKKIILITLLLLLSCDSNNPLDIDNSQICEDSTWMVDDCGICRECQTEECNWNDQMDQCNECFGDNGSCTGCMDPIAINYDVNSTIHNDNQCDYDNFIYIEYIVDYFQNIDVIIDPDYKIIRPGRAAYFVNYLDELIIININETESLSISIGGMDYIIFENEGLIEYHIENYDIPGILLIQNYE